MLCVLVCVAALRSAFRVSNDTAELSTTKNTIRRILQRPTGPRHDTSIIPALINPEFDFRSSFGPVLTGHSEFEFYVYWLTNMLHYDRYP